MARKSSVGQRGGVVAGVGAVCVAGGAAALLVGMSGAGAGRGDAGRAAATARLRAAHIRQVGEVTIASPRPYFVPYSGQGPSLSAGRVAWTANSGQGATGSSIDRIYLYDLARRQLSTPVYSRYGVNGFIGDYALAGDELAYVDTGVTPARIFTWQVCIDDLRHRRSRVVVASPPGASSYIPPRIAFDGTHLLVLQTAILGSNAATATPENTVLLYTLSRPDQKPETLARIRQAASLGDPALTRDIALWTTQVFGRHPSSRLTAYDMRRRVRHAIPVGDVSEVAANGDYVVWKSGLASMPGGRIGLYSLQGERILSGDLAHGDKATFPSVGGDLVSWTSVDNLRVQVYSLAARRVVHDAAPVPRRVYGLSAVAGDTAGAPAAGRAVSWVYTANVLGKGPQRGYVVVRPVGP